MVMRENGDMEFESDKSYFEDISPLKDCTKDGLVLLVEESLVIRCTFLIHVKKYDSDQ
jgi:hypothetical protein